MPTEIFRNIRAVATDVDGVLTDNAVWWSPTGDDYKRFNFIDIAGVSMARKAGLPIALISGDSTPTGLALVQRYADKFSLTDVFKGCHDKADALRQFAAAHRLELSQICYIGDDYLDVPALAIAGVAVAPADAQSIARAQANYIAKANGGYGVVREVIDAILEQNPELTEQKP